jgi:KEOPS complex subunit Pcc1
LFIGGFSLKLSAEFTFEIKNASLIYQTVLPELDEAFSDRSVISLLLEDSKHLLLKVKAEDIVSMRSALNTWFRLIQIALEVSEATIEACNCSPN